MPLVADFSFNFSSCDFCNKIELSKSRMECIYLIFMMRSFIVLNIVLLMYLFCIFFILNFL